MELKVGLFFALLALVLFWFLILESGSLFFTGFIGLVLLGLISWAVGRRL